MVTMRWQSLIQPWRKPNKFTERREENTMKIHVWIAGFVPLATALLLGASQAKVETGGTRQTQSAAVEVKIDNFSFAPATVTVSPGTTITWTNRDDIPHSVVSDDKIFKS